MVFSVSALCFDMLFSQMFCKYWISSLFFSFHFALMIFLFYSSLFKSCRLISILGPFSHQVGNFQNRQQDTLWHLVSWRTISPKDATQSVLNVIENILLSHFVCQINCFPKDEVKCPKADNPKTVSKTGTFK